MTAKKKPLSNEEEEQKARIWQFVLEHEGFLCDPPPEGLGFPRPGMIPGYYLESPTSGSSTGSGCRT